MSEATRPASTPRPPLPLLRPLLLSIRFSTSLPDLDLDIPNPANTTVAALKHLIRDRLDSTHNTRRLRFIYQGRILQDDATLSTALALPTPSPASTSSRPSQADEHDFTGKGKGKGKAVEGQLDRQQNRVYVICSIGDALSPSQLADEAAAARKAPTPSTPSGRPFATQQDGPSASRRQNAAATTRPTPRGFDRLLAAGFTQAEVSQLRLQFRDIQAQRHTPDAMPSPDTLQSMEDSWMDANAGDAVPGGGTGAVGPAGEAAPADDALGTMHEQLDGFIKGLAMGFFWPLGGLSWLTREEGIVSPRWRVWIGFGVSFSVLIGIMRALFGNE
ncbi:hypothetical protein ACRALDRAFT_1071395 [Sodiomyces alcalophilus JCM 7366]|uniref:uncharacterized protein n=1 Tax=Sodiomyces alcalophilus JCM 7366 TaxID=591952 RepID=UPI0039B3CA39